jgi:hypothetical protein
VRLQGRDDIRTECAGVMAGAWFAGIGKRGHDLIGICALSRQRGRLALS